MRQDIFSREYKAVHWPYQAPVQAVSSRCFKYRREDIGWDADIAHEISGYVRKHNFANPTRPCSKGCDPYSVHPSLASTREE